MQPRSPMIDPHLSIPDPKEPIVNSFDPSPSRSTSSAGLNNSEAAILHTSQLLAAAVDTLAKSNANAPKPAPIRVRDPPVFTGKPEEVEPFLRHIEGTIALNPASFSTPTLATSFISRYLGTGSPKNWYEGIERHHPEWLHDLRQFKAAFRSHFGDPALQDTMQRKLERLRQEGSCTHYASKFREYSSYLDLTEYTKCRMFYNGLQEDVKDWFIVSGKPDTLDEMEKLAIRVDKRLFERRMEKKRKGSNYPGRSRPNQ